ncbi:endonuclease/exonuclease/phosphatase family protein [Chitinophaga sp. Cy-1792]|uniref:endonuclease/exonuclease/phosphatase family protein n=1 Tax=Chitinophaga sp. Cy-1792 TaxID=2608339 RepID=UPI00141FAE61|nr:endonuclease/exonuclease/phosphatase family protein [Chitinophaga sp. Cy-1792]NIG52304.1 endonuclease/exonuclease/phosphatase family protein [Chitinophaga sp. Cy-1792]
MKTFLRFLLICVNILVPLALLAATFFPFIDPHGFWPAGFAGLTFPVFFLLNLLLLPLWIILRKKYWLLPVLALLFSADAVLRTWAIHPFRENKMDKTYGSKEFTVMTYNTSNMGLLYYKDVKPVRSNVYNTVVYAQADILCLQEFYTNDWKEQSNNIDSIRMKAGYEHYYFTNDKTHWDTWHYGIALFSHHPILNATTIPCGYSSNGSGSSFLQADLLVNQDTIRVITVQLASYMFTRAEFREMYNFKQGMVEHKEDIKNLARKMKMTFTRRSDQARQLRALITASPYPLIVCGDFNDTPVSYTYQTVAAPLQDAFLRCGSGWGRTMSYMSPSLRIDYILPSKQFEIEACDAIRVADSEHFPVIARLLLKK